MREMDKKKSHRNWLPLPQPPTSGSALQQTEDYIFPLASTPPISLLTDASSDLDSEDDCDSGDVVTSGFSGMGQAPSVVKLRQDFKKENDASNDFHSRKENDYGDGDVLTSEFSGTGQAPPDMKQRRNVEKENDASSDFDYENDYDGGDVVASVFSGTGQSASAVKQRRDTEKGNDLSSDLDYENDYDGGVVASVFSGTEQVPLALKQRREKDTQKDPESTREKIYGGRLSVVILYCLVVICFVMWSALLSLFLVKCSLLAKGDLTSVLEELAERKRENGGIAKDVVQVLGELYNLTGNLTSVLEELAELKRGIGRIAKDVVQVQEKLHNLTDFLCLNCPHNWQHFQRNCYFLSTLPGTWTSAKQSCEAEGARLVIVNNKAEQNFLTRQMIHDQVAWIGLSDAVTEGKWLWVDGTPLTLSFWGHGEPNNLNQKGEDCATLQSVGKWNDVLCSNNNFWICEQKC